MDRTALTAVIDEQLRANPDAAIVFTPEELSALTDADARAIVAHLNGQALMRLPQREIKFFEWLKTADPPVWDDMWGGPIEEYLVSISFLPRLIEGGEGYPICDLETTPNYYFVKDFLRVPEGADYLEATLGRARAGKKLSTEQKLVFESQLGGIDLWHFAYKYHIDIGEAKAAVARLVEDNVILHVPLAHALASFISI